MLSSCSIVALTIASPANAQEECRGYLMRFFSIACAAFDGSDTAFVNERPGSRTADRLGTAAAEIASNTVAGGKQGRVGSGPTSGGGKTHTNRSVHGTNNPGHGGKP